MSRNFDLLRRAKKGQALFLPQINHSQVNKNVPYGPNEEPAPTETVSPERRVPWPSQALNGTALEQLTKLVRRVFVYANSSAPRTVSFSSVEGSGSTEMCLQAGMTLASQGTGSVCIVDANLRAPWLHRLLEIESAPGLTDAMIHPDSMKECVVRIGDRGNLWAVPAGSLNSHAEAVLTSDRLRARISELKEQFDFVLIDVPAVNSHADAVLIGQMTDGLILVLEANFTRRETARSAKEALEATNINLLGAILNNRTFPIPEALYRWL